MINFQFFLIAMSNFFRLFSRKKHIKDRSQQSLYYKVVALVGQENIGNSPSNSQYSE